MPIVNVGDKGNINTEICGKNIMDIKKYHGVYNYSKPKIAAFSEIVFPYRPNIESDGVAYTVSCKKDIEYTMSITNPNPNYVIAIGEYKNMQDATDEKKVIGYIEPQQTTKISYKAIGNGILVCLLAAKWTDGSSNSHECTESELVQVEIGNTATSYETPKKHTFFALATPNGLPGIKVDSGGNYTDKDGQQWISDEITMVERIQRIGRIASYNGEQIDTEYMSSYGELSAGAEVIYVLKEPIVIPLTEEEISMFKEMHTNYPTTTVLNDENADMELTYTVDTQSYVDTKIAEISKAII